MIKMEPSSSLQIAMSKFSPAAFLGVIFTALGLQAWAVAMTLALMAIDTLTGAARAHYGEGNFDGNKYKKGVILKWLSFLMILGTGIFVMGFGGYLEELKTAGLSPVGRSMIDWVPMALLFWLAISELSSAIANFSALNKTVNGDTSFSRGLDLLGRLLGKFSAAAIDRGEKTIAAVDATITTTTTTTTDTTTEVKATIEAPVSNPTV